jgi:hypothetical protein
LLNIKYSMVGWISPFFTGKFNAITFRKKKLRICLIVLICTPCTEKNYCRESRIRFMRQKNPWVIYSSLNSSSYISNRYFYFSLSIVIFSANNYQNCHKHRFVPLQYYYLILIILWNSLIF